MTGRRRPPAVPGDGRTLTPPDDGTVTPLVIGMMLCLLFLTTGITAAGSAFLHNANLQHLCDGAATTAADTITDETTNPQPLGDTIDTYLREYRSNASTTLTLTGTTLTLSCTATNPITLGVLFGHPTLTQTVTAAAQTNYHNQ